MTELTLLVLRLAFLAVLWLFIFGIVYALRSDLFGQRVRKLREETGQGGGSPFPQSPYAAAASAPPRAAQPVVQPPPISTMPSGANSGAVPSRAKATTSTARHLVITSGAKAGTEIPLGTEPLTIGRSSESGLVIRDDYTSTHHARLLLWNDEWMIQDLDSTNGTFLDGKRVSVPTQVPLDTPIRIGATSFELRR
ncbi:FHA domain-containing protein [Clavibacter lycopersici]|uniref:FHA domain-containing protein n=1 Tax=Clavibacter lycopersici TaxID=2301718 RepID=A0A399T1C2_9MICO|nr:FHA domain-containing protein [Clavibacter lycopersici]RIJ50250.1 FHA domain-containing protein [Clavibacter lycopersici]RIJ61561.1 FHA domain-containing protein [Clavibacter lycopersici]